MDGVKHGSEWEGLSGLCVAVMSNSEGWNGAKQNGLEEL